MANVRLKDITFPGLDNTYKLPVEADDFSTSKTYAVGEYCIHDGVLCQCTTAISTAGAWDATKWSVDVKLAEQVGDLKTALGENTQNLIPGFKSSVTVNYVTFSSTKLGYLNVHGTGSQAGGRKNKLTNTFTLAAGSYEFTIKGGVPTNLTFYVENASGDTIIAYINPSQNSKTFTLAAETTVYIGAQVENQASYNLDGLLLQLVKGTSKSIIPPFTAVDYIARDNIDKLWDKTSLIDDLSFDSYDTLKDVLPFMVGGFTSQGEISTTNNYRLISADQYTTNVPIYLHTPTGYKYGVMFYVGASKIDSGWIIGGYTIPAGSTFRISIAKDPEDYAAITDIKTSPLYTNFVMYATKSQEVQSIGIKALSVSNPWSQGACIVGRKVVGFNASSDDHSTNGTARVYDADNSLDQIGSMAHNLGHSVTADYCSDTDTMLVANGTYEVGVNPTIYFIKNASAVVDELANILYNGDNVFGIDVTGLTGQGVGACFGESSQIVYLLMLESASQYNNQDTKYIYKMLMGMGSNDLTEQFESGNFGTFISGCSANEYNGTMHLLKSYSLSLIGELQGLKFRNGYLFMSCDTTRLEGTKTPYLAKIKVYNTGVELEKLYQIPTQDNDGVLQSTEAEGFVFDGLDGYIALWAGENGRIVKFNTII